MQVAWQYQPTRYITLSIFDVGNFSIGTVMTEIWFCQVMVSQLTTPRCVQLASEQCESVS
uniref:Uncharacterized protein n=1 Tax=Anguilla anguilla TaxID=7936 RepID=A0A0E9WBK3_ANGAN